MPRLHTSLPQNLVGEVDATKKEIELALSQEDEKDVYHALEQAFFRNARVYMFVVTTRFITDLLRMDSQADAAIMIPLLDIPMMFSRVAAVSDEVGWTKYVRFTLTQLCEEAIAMDAPFVAAALVVRYGVHQPNISLRALASNPNYHRLLDTNWLGALCPGRIFNNHDLKVAVGTAKGSHNDFVQYNLAEIVSAHNDAAPAFRGLTPARVTVLRDEYFRDLFVSIFGRSPELVAATDPAPTPAKSKKGKKAKKASAPKLFSGTRYPRQWAEDANSDDEEPQHNDYDEDDDSAAGETNSAFTPVKHRADMKVSEAMRDLVCFDPRLIRAKVQPINLLSVSTRLSNLNKKCKELSREVFALRKENEKLLNTKPIDMSSSNFPCLSPTSSSSAVSTPVDRPPQQPTQITNPPTPHSTNPPRTQQGHGTPQPAYSTAATPAPPAPTTTYPVPQLDPTAMQTMMNFFAFSQQQQQQQRQAPFSAAAPHGGQAFTQTPPDFYDTVRNSPSATGVLVPGPTPTPIATIVSHESHAKKGRAGKKNHPTTHARTNRPLKRDETATGPTPPRDMSFLEMMRMKK